ncbi:restriction endonuclease subunit S [Bacteroides fragilis]|uniref:restriction endonuclease subunit S n=1 Tax=Bacteroides fragilis TaxID=817 RepID=UPI001E5A9B38|nr:restriction endonuclease subunit S [Bacteroides fragilis]
MEKDMQSYRLSDLVKIKNGKDHKMLSNGKYPVLGSGGIMRYVDKFLYDKPSVLLPRKGTLDNIQYCDMPFWTVDTLYYTEVNTNLANPYYLYRYLSLLDLSNLDSGTGVPSMTFDNYYGLKIFLPNIEKQTKIAQILQTLDKKITINRQINQNLEAMAKQLYDYWFVQFDFPNEEGKPYKSSGGKMVWHEKLKRNIPIGWNNGTLIDIANITMGQSPDGTSYNEIGEGVLFYQGSTDFGMRFPSVRQYTTAPSRFAKKGDILMSVRAPVGAVNIANNDCCIGRGLSALNSKIGSTTHLYYILNDLRIVFDQRNAVGTTFGSITKEDLYSLPIVIPAKEVISAFDKICSPMFDRQMLLGEEIDSLIKQRDELLPLLMNGQVSVNSDLSLD